MALPTSPEQEKVVNASIGAAIGLVVAGPVGAIIGSLVGGLHAINKQKKSQG